jgi:DNA polymerase-3 subunit epsilon
VQFHDRPLAIVDVETTGHAATYGRIIEIAVIRVEEGNVKRTFQSLINPERFIPAFIEQLTGITNRDLEAAPLFEEAARDILGLLDGALLVAHNARFDYGFIKHEFQRLGWTYNARCLCTLKLSRRLFPQHRHHDLSSIIRRHGIAIGGRHRAMSDARATYEFLKIVEATHEAASLEKTVSALLKTSTIPSHLDPQVLDNLPASCGVYLLRGKEGELLYVGKSVNVKERVKSHFANDHTSSREMKMCQQVFAIEVQPTAGELGALLLESKLIKEMRPVYNVAARRQLGIVIARGVMTEQGYVQVRIETIDHIASGDASSILAIFKHTRQAREYLNRVSKEHKLCHKLLGLERTHSYCFAYHLHHCKGACMGEEEPVLYNARAAMAFATRRVKAWPYRGAIVIEERDEATGEGEVFLIDQWCLVSSFKYSDDAHQLRISGAHRFDYDAYKIISRYVLRSIHRERIKVLSREELIALVGEENVPAR